MDIKLSCLKKLQRRNTWSCHKIQKDSGRGKKKTEYQSMNIKLEQQYRTDY